MKTFEIDVEIRVRKTLILSGPVSVEDARSVIHNTLEGGNNIPLSTFQKWEAGSGYGHMIPVEAVVDNDPQIVDVRQVAE